MIHLLCHLAKVELNNNNCIVIFKKSGYVTKLETVIHDVIIKGTYIEHVTENTLKELSRF